MLRKAFLVLGVSAALAVLTCAGAGQAAVPLAVTISSPQMVAPGKVGFEVAITGLRPELAPTIEGRATVGGRSFQGPAAPVPAARIPAAIDLPSGKVRVGGDASVVDFTPIPRIEENTPITLEITVRQASDVATGRQTGVLLLPTVIVPGYLNDLGGKSAPGIIGLLEQRGYHATAGPPDLFWFSYRSRALGLKDAARTLAAYVRDVVLQKTYATRINVVGFSLGGLLVRWNLAFEPGWDHLVNRFVMVGVPNQGAVAPYVYAWYAIGSLARTAAAHDLLPTFPFWQATRYSSWRFPPDGHNETLAELNSHPLPEGIRVYAFYGNQAQLDPHDRGTWAGVIGDLRDVQHAEFSSGPGDGLVLSASALGLPINGGAGIPGFPERLVMKTDLGAVSHLSLMQVAGTKIADALTDRQAAARPEPVEGQRWRQRPEAAPTNHRGFFIGGMGFLSGGGRR